MNAEDENFIRNVMVVPSYEVYRGLRFVDPYFYVYRCYVKKRWIGLPLLRLCSEEFKGETKDYYSSAINSGKILINGKKSSAEYILKDNDLIEHRCHRHEPPALDESITFLRLTADVVVINKPPSYPVHPCGRFNYNSIISRLEFEHNLKNLKVVHRLDRLASGLLILAKTLQASQIFDSHIRDRKVTKLYIAKVRGHFPEGVIECNLQLKSISPRLGVVVVAEGVSQTGKESSTRFFCLSKYTDGEYGPQSIVLCAPLTGRTHQIRVHLQSLKHPILLDPLYDDPCWAEPHKTPEDSVSLLVQKFAETPVSAGLVDEPKKLLKRRYDDSLNQERTVVNDSIILEQISRVLKNVGLPDSVIERRLTNFDHHCSECRVAREPPPLHELQLFLHAYRYFGPGWDYCASIPNWAVNVTEELINQTVAKLIKNK